VQRLPWYAFLYRLFGAQGTFWLWIVCAIALWWTAGPTVNRLANRQPRALRVSQVATLGDLTRWVTLEGIELRLDRRLLLSTAPTLPPVPLLLDPSDPSSAWWARTRALADALQGDGQTVAASLGGIAGAGVATRRRAARDALGPRLAKLEGGDVPEALPAPERVVLLQEQDVAAMSAPPPPAVDAPVGPGAFARLLERRAALIRERVLPARRLTGLLIATPPTLAESVKRELDTLVAPRLLQVGRAPHDLESYIFAAAAITLVFLATGFYAATRAPAPPPPAPAPAPAA
jgi:hypothetical protein